MLKFKSYLAEANSEGLMAAKHLGDGVVFKDAKNEVYTLASIQFYPDIQVAVDKFSDKGYGIEEVGKVGKSGTVIELKGKQQNVFLVRYGNKVKGIMPSSVGLQYANSSEKSELKPQTLGIKETWYKKKSYVSAINAGINARSDLTESLKEYLLLLVEYYEKGAPKKLKDMFKEFNYDNFPMNEIKKNFGEMIGPLAIMGTGLFPKLKLSNSSEIFFPLRGNEPLMDFAMRNGKKEYTFSAKSGKSTTNTVKPVDIVRLINQNSRLKKKWNGEPEFEVMKILDNHSIAQGPIVACNYMRVKGINKDMMKHWMSKTEKTWKYDKAVYGKFVDNNKLGNKPTWGEILYACETTLTGLSKGKKPKLNYADLFVDATGGNVYYINLLKMNGGIPQFETYTGKKPSAVLRTKNGKTRAKDKIGVQLLS